MDFRVLGPLEVRGERGAVNLGGHKPRAVLAVLLLHANEPLSSVRLVQAVWGEEDETPELRKSLQVSVSRLRKALGDPQLVATKGQNYQVQVRPGELDADRFARLLEDGRHALASRQAEQAANSLREALSLWRGPPLADLAVESFAVEDIRRLEEQRLEALELRVEADLNAGRHDALVGELRQLVADHPGHERFAGQLMLALYRCGRQAEALEAYRSARHTLVEEIGVEPGPALRRLHEKILQQDASLEAPPARAELPRELDAATAPPLVGRNTELVWLRERWDRAQRGTGSFVAMTGAHGIGRSRLAAELAGDVHRLGGTVLYAAGAGPPDATLAALKGAREATRPTLLVVDDADRADDDVLTKLADLTRVLPTMSVLALATGERRDAFAPPDADGVLDLGPLDGEAVREIAAPYASGADGEEVPVQWLLKTSGGVPRRVHELASEWARREAARRVDAVAGRTAAERAELRSMEDELAIGVVELQRADERLALLGDKDEPVVCPFKGLAPFDVADAEYFFGRERLIAELVARLVGTSLLGVVGPSGSGKSSVVRAGLLPALAGGVLPGSEEWTQILIRPGEHPLEELGGAAADIDTDRKVLLAIDQFEETFTACRDEDERSGFIAELIRVACDPHERGMVVLVIRADYYGSCAAYPELSSLLAANHVLVGPMRRDELRNAVEGPAVRTGLRVEPELVDALVADVEDEPGALPLLSTSLLELWQRRDGRRLRLASYEGTGGVHGAVARLAEEGFGRLDEAQRAVARTVLLRLAEVEIEGGVERRRLPRHEVEDGRGDVAAVIDLLADARLLTVSAGTVEFAHEALLREWPRLRDWIEDDREDLRIHRNLNSAAKEWQRLGRDEGALYRGSRLAEAREWSEHTDLRATDLERDFLSASLGRERRERGARRRRLRLAFAGLVVALAAITAVAIVALYQGREAERQRDIAASGELAARATGFLDADPSLALALALRALDRQDTQQAEAVVRQATYATRGTGVWKLTDWLNAAKPSADGREIVTAGRDGIVRIWNLDRKRVTSTIEGHRGEVADASLSPDGRLVASAGRKDGTVALSDADGSHRSVALDLSGPKSPDGELAAQPTGVEFSPDGERLAVAVSDGTVRILPIGGGLEPRALAGHRSWVYSASFSGDGSHLVSASADLTARIWDLASGDSTSLPHPGEVLSASFSPDDRHVATAGGDGVVRIWDADGSERLASIRVDRQPLFWVRYSPDGRRLVTAGADGVVRVIDVRGRSLIDELKGHRGRALQAAFIQGGGAVVSAGEDGTLRAWVPTDGAVIRGWASGLSISADGRYAASGDDAGSVRVWDLATGKGTRLPGHEQPSVAEFSPDSTRIVSASWDGTVRISKLGSGASRRVPSDKSAKYSVGFSPDGDRIVLGGSLADPRIVIQAPSGGARDVLRGHTEAVYDVEFSHDGSHLVSASEDGTARIWNAATGKEERVLRGHGEAVRTAAFSRSGARVVTAGADGTVRIWRVGDGTTRILRGHEGPVFSAQFNRAGDRVVSAGQDGTIRIWSPTGGDPLLTLFTHDGAAVGAAFTPDGRKVVSAGEDGILRIAQCEVCGRFSAVLRLARTRAVRDLSLRERARLLPLDG